MRIYLTIIMLALALTARGELHYFTAGRASVPAGEVKAVEIRAANAGARTGSARCAGWGVSWPGADLTLTFDFRDYVDGVSEPLATLGYLPARQTSVKGLDTSGGFNTMAIEWNADSTVTILLGQRALKPAIQLDSLPKPTGEIRVYPIGTPAGLTLQDFIIETNDNAFERLATGYTPAQLAAAPRWHYLDRENDPLIALPGGQYTLAQIGNDLIYIGGAITNSRHWKSGMLKGRLHPTGFDGYYRLEWIDATGRLLHGENYAETDPATGTLRLTFPALSASLRFAPSRPR